MAPPASAVAAPPVAYGSPMYLQLGSFRDPANAYRLKTRLEREGLAGGAFGGAHVSTSLVRGASYYRVRIGPLESGVNAERALRQAQALGHKDARLLKP